MIYEDGWDEGEEGVRVKLIVAAYDWTFFRPNRDDHQESLNKLIHGTKLKLYGGPNQPEIEAGMQLMKITHDSIIVYINCT